MQVELIHSEIFFLYSLFLHYCLINIHIFDYPDSRFSGLFTQVPTSPDNRGFGFTLNVAYFSPIQIPIKWLPLRDL